MRLGKKKSAEVFLQGSRKKRRFPILSWFAFTGAPWQGAEMQVTMVIKASCGFEKNKTNLGRNGFPSQPIWKRWFMQEWKK